VVLEFQNLPLIPQKSRFEKCEFFIIFVCLLAAFKRPASGRRGRGDKAAAARESRKSEFIQRVRRKIMFNDGKYDNVDEMS
jgi:hypothetical protein